MWAWLKTGGLHWQVLLALAVGVAAGFITRDLPPAVSGPLVGFYEVLGRVFLQALKMLVVPLVVSSIVCGVIGIGSTRALGNIGFKTLLYYLTTTLIAVLIGLGLVNLIQPGVMDGRPVKELIGLTEEAGAILSKIEAQERQGLADFLLRFVPGNLIAAAAEGQLLGLIAFSLVFGYFTTRLEGKAAEVAAEFWKGLFAVMMRITGWLIRFAPLGVFGLVAGIVTRTGLAAIGPMALFVMTVLAALAVHVVLVLGLLLRWLGQVGPARHWRAMLPAVLAAFSTSSSSATVPVTLDCLERRAGLSNRVASFVIPLGATVNMDGTALYECVAVMFIAQAYGLALDVPTQFLIVGLALMTSVGVAGVPAASLVAILIILEAVGLPAEGVGFILAVDRLLDMCRTGVNVFSDSCGAVIVARSEGERPYKNLPTLTHRKGVW